jgi:hypothetical protein
MVNPPICAVALSCGSRVRTSPTGRPKKPWPPGFKVPRFSRLWVGNFHPRLDRYDLFLPVATRRNKPAPFIVSRLWV